MKANVKTKENIDKALVTRQKALVAKAKGQGISYCISLWINEGEKAGVYDKQGYLNWIKGITGAEDANYDILIQINSAVSSSKDWNMLKAI